jgi:hypothetical protein
MKTAEEILHEKYASDKWEPNKKGIIEAMEEYSNQQRSELTDEEIIETAKNRFADTTHGMSKEVGFEESAKELSSLMSADLRKELIDYDVWLYSKGKKSDAFTAEELVDLYLSSRPDSKAVTDEKSYPDLTCDVCGRHPTVIVQTQFGRYCMEHARYI